VRLRHYHAAHGFAVIEGNHPLFDALTLLVAFAGDQQQIDAGSS
jgi:hypothetical protein